MVYGVFSTAPLEGFVNGLLGYSFSRYLFLKFIEENE